MLPPSIPGRWTTAPLPTDLILTKVPDMSVFQVAVEHEELGFRTEVGGIAQAGGLQVSFGALGHERGSRS